MFANVSRPQKQLNAIHFIKFFYRFVFVLLTDCYMTFIILNECCVCDKLSLFISNFYDLLVRLPFPLWAVSCIYVLPLVY